VSRSPVLLIEDNPDDALLMHRAFDRCQAGRELVVAGTGEEAIALLSPSRGRNLAPLRLSLVLLDLDLPGNDGIEVLRRIRTQAATRTIPVIVFTSSRVPADVTACYELGPTATSRSRSGSTRSSRPSRRSAVTGSR
jgi:CheY-like chemotaxis protein